GLVGSEDDVDLRILEAHPFEIARIVVVGKQRRGAVAEKARERLVGRRRGGVAQVPRRALEEWLVLDVIRRRLQLERLLRDQLDDGSLVVNGALLLRMRLDVRLDVGARDAFREEVPPRRIGLAAVERLV